MRHLTKNHLLSNVQHGFVKRRSTCTNVLESLNHWTLAIQDGHSVSILILIRLLIRELTKSCFTA